jgi:hypothetical protein
MHLAKVISVCLFLIIVSNSKAYALDLSAGGIVSYPKSPDVFFESYDTGGGVQLYVPFSANIGLSSSMVRFRIKKSIFTSGGTLSNFQAGLYAKFGIGDSYQTPVGQLELYTRISASYLYLTLSDLTIIFGDSYKGGNKSDSIVAGGFGMELLIREGLPSIFIEVKYSKTFRDPKWETLPIVVGLSF